MDIFKMLATEKDAKYLTLEEFLVGLRKQNIPMKEKQLRELFAIIDTGGDGIVEFTEFCSLNGLRMSRNVPPGPKRGHLPLQRRATRTNIFD